MIRPPGSLRVGRARHAGTASLELVISLPFLMILAGMLFTVTWSCLIKGQAVQEARGRAWHARSGAGGGGSLDSGSGDIRLSELAGRPVDAGLRSGSGSKSHGRVEQLQNAPRYFTFGTITAKAKHEVFSDPWDHEAITFEEQAPMSLDKRVFVFGLSALTGQLMGALKDAVQPPHGESEAQQKAQNATDSVRKEKERLDREVETLRAHLSDLRDRLSAARAKKNNALVQSLEDEIDRTQKSLDSAEKARKHLQKGMDLLPKP